jgi:hypothetical protein
VLRSLREQLDGQPVSILLTDAAGLVLARLTADAELERHLDRVQLVPGFSYAERYVGTNGIGTALEGGRPMHVFGHEHYAEHLEDLACAAVPIAHPVSGKTVGAMNLTCWREDAGSLLLTLAKSTAAQIRQALLAETGTRELALFQEYLRACRRSAGIVLAVDTDVAMVNDRARAVLDPADQAALLQHGADALAAGKLSRPGRLEVDLPTGGTARMTLRPFPPADVGHLVALDADPAVMRFLTGDFLGWFEFRPLDQVGTGIELGYRLRRAAWGRGLATEGARALVDDGFTGPLVQRVVA